MQQMCAVDRTRMWHQATHPELNSNLLTTVDSLNESSFQVRQYSWKHFYLSFSRSSSKMDRRPERRLHLYMVKSLTSHARSSLEHKLAQVIKMRISNESSIDSLHYSRLNSWEPWPNRRENWATSPELSPHWGKDEKNYKTRGMSVWAQFFSVYNCENTKQKLWAITSKLIK
jgi:hypothetical protein